MKKTLTLLLTCILTSMFLLTGCDSQDYQNAINAYNNGNYDEAEALFTALGDYEDSDMWLNIIVATKSIDTLSDSSSPADIYAVYQKYTEISYSMRNSVLNLDKLHSYIDDYGNFYLTDEMIRQIETDYSDVVGSLGITGLDFYLMIGGVRIEGYSYVESPKVASKNQVSDTQYEVYGTIVVADKYGNNLFKNFTATYTFEYDPEDKELSLHRSMRLK